MALASSLVSGLAAVVATGACADPQPLSLAANEPAREGAGDLPARLDEQGIIERLILSVRGSGVVFVRDSRELTSGEFGDHLQSTWQRHRAEIDTARGLIERATRPVAGKRPIMVRTAEAEPYTADDWLHSRLDEVKSGAKLGAVATQRTSEPTTREVSISDVLLIIERSSLEFVVPLRKGGAEVVDARTFADRLQTKWQWLGKDIKEVDRFVDEIASDAFTAFKPYRVRLSDGTEQDVQPWLRARVEDKRRALGAAQVGGP